MSHTGATEDDILLACCISVVPHSNDIQAASEGGVKGKDDSEGDQEGSDLMSALMEEVSGDEGDNRRIGRVLRVIVSQRNREGVLVRVPDSVDVPIHLTCSSSVQFPHESKRCAVVRCEHVRVDVAKLADHRL